LGVLDLPYRLGKYTLHRSLGGGGMGRVYLATLEGAGGFERDIAIKLVRAELADSQRAIEMFLREGRALAALNHRNVIQVFELDTEGNQLYLAMEYLRGLDLSQLRARGPLAWAVAAFIASEAARGLASAHAIRSADAPNGIVHGDVSPSNVMACHDGSVKVLDFGIARPVGRTGGSISGKMPYLPPEVVVGGAPDAGTDVYSLGVVLYELLTGEKLFRAGSDPEMAQRVLRDVVPGPSTIAKDMPPALEALVMSAIARDRTQRPASAQDFAHALDRIVDGRVGAADLAGLVASLTEKPAVRSTELATPVGRTEVAAHAYTVSQTATATPSASDARELNPLRTWSSPSSSPSRRALPTTKHGMRRALIAVTAALVAGGAIAVWQLRGESAPSSESSVVPMRAAVETGEAAPASASASAPAPASAPASAPVAAAEPPPVATANGHAAKPARRKRILTRPKRPPSAQAGSGSISPGFIANPFEKK
jgi:serine/threonine-protein kinase